MKNILVWLFIIGLVSFSSFFSLPNHPKSLILLGWPAWFSAYLGVLVKCYRRAVPLPMLMHRVEKDKQPVLYKLIYVCLAFIGVIAVVVTLLIAFVPK